MSTMDSRSLFELCPSDFCCSFFNAAIIILSKSLDSFFESIVFSRIFFNSSFRTSLSVISFSGGLIVVSTVTSAGTFGISIPFPGFPFPLYFPFPDFPLSPFDDPLVGGESIFFGLSHFSARCFVFPQT